MRVDKQSKMLNYFHIFVLKGRVDIDGSQAPQKGPSYGEFLCSNAIRQRPPSREQYCSFCSSYLWASSFLQEKFWRVCSPAHRSLLLRANVTKIWCYKLYIPMCLPFIVNDNLQVPLGVLFHIEQYNDDIKEIWKSTYHPLGNGGNGTGDSTQVSSFPTLFGGDQLTTERARTVRNVLSNSDSASSRLEGLIPVTEDWHAEGMCACFGSSACVYVCVV